MKKNKFLKHLKDNSCVATGRQKGSHAQFKNLVSGKKTIVPLHDNIDDMLCKAICKQLGIPAPLSK